MQNQWTAFLNQDPNDPEVQFALESVKILTESKNNFLAKLSFETEPAEFGKVLSINNSKTQ